MTWTGVWLSPLVRCQMSQLSTVPKASLPASARARGSGDVVEDPGDLGGGEVGVEDEACFRLNHGLGAVVD